jgi:hypothetical protein
MGGGLIVEVRLQILSRTGARSLSAAPQGWPAIIYIVFWGDLQLLCKWLCLVNIAFVLIILLCKL